MIENKTIIGGLIVSIVALIAFAFSMSMADDIGGEPYSPIAIFTHQAKGPQVSTVVDTTGSAYASVDMQYPHLRGPNSDVLNSAITKQMKDIKTEFLKSAEEGWRARVETASPNERFPAAPVKESDKASLIVTWTLAQLNSHMVSLKVDMSEYTFGAHPSEAIMTYNFDVTTGKLLTLGDIYSNTPDYLAKISSSAMGELSSRFGSLGADKKTLAAGAGPDAKNFEAFTTDGHTVTVYFQTYQVGPRTIGQPEVRLPLQWE